MSLHFDLQTLDILAKLKVHSYGYCRGKLRKRRRRCRSVSPPGAEDASLPPPPFRGRRARRNEGQAKDWLLARFRKKRRMGLGRVGSGRGFDSWPTPDRKERGRGKKKGVNEPKGGGNRWRWWLRPKSILAVEISFSSHPLFTKRRRQTDRLRAGRDAINCLFPGSSAVGRRSSLEASSSVFSFPRSLEIGEIAIRLALT